jgi:hypothetical protein
MDLDPYAAADPPALDPSAIMAAFHPAALPMPAPPAPGSVVLVYAPITFYPPPTPAAVAAEPAPPGAAYRRVQPRRFSLAELLLHAGQAVLGVGTCDVAFSLVTGHPNPVLVAAPLAGALMILGGAIGITHQENAR